MKERKSTWLITSLLLMLTVILACNLDKIDDNNDNGTPCPTPPQAAFTVDKSTGAVPLTITFTNTSTSATTFNWDFGDATSATSKDPAKKVFTQAGNYTIVLIASNGTCRDTSTTIITVVDPLVPAHACVSIVSQSNNGESPSTVSVSASCSMSASAFAWDFGDPASGATNTATGITSEHTYNTAGTYSIKLSATGPANSDDTTIIVVVKIPPPPKPLASFTVSNNGCDAPCPIQFTNTSVNAVSQVWAFGDGGTSAAVSPAHTYLNKYSGTVTLIVTGAGGDKDTAEAVVAVVKRPIADFNFVNNNCTGPCAVNFTENCQFETAYQWDFMDLPTSTQPNPTHTFTNKGSYQVRLIALNADGSDTITKTVTIKSPFFASVIDVNGSDVDPILGVQRSDGQYHILFKQNGYKSVLVNIAQTVGNIANYTLTDLDDFNEAIPSGDGGFALIGTDNATTSNATLVKIGSGQTTTFSKKIAFTGAAQFSSGNGVTLNSSNQFVVTGQYIPTGGGDLFPGFTFVSQTGVLSGNTFIGIPTATIGSLTGEGIAQLSNGSYMLIAPQFTFGGSPKRYLVECNATGTYTNNKNLGTTVSLKQIIGINSTPVVLQLENSVYSLVKYNSTSISALGTITLAGVTVQQITVAPDGNIIATGSKNSHAWMAKFNSSNMSSTPIWEHEYPQVTGSTLGKSVTTTSDGGYLVSGLHTASNGTKFLYLIKTDALGTTE